MANGTNLAVGVNSGSPTFEVEEAVLFPFDDCSIPFRKDVLMSLIPGARGPGEHREGGPYEDADHPGDPVLQLGGPGTPDSTEIIFPTILQVDDEYRMWYSCSGDSSGDTSPCYYSGGPPIDNRRRIGYAISKDGFNWEKPILGLVEYNGSKENNLVDEDGGELRFTAYDPEDSDPNKRFKMVSIGGMMRLHIHYSADGLTWTKGKAVGQGIEPGTPPFKFRGCWYVNGQGGPGPFNKTIPHPVDGAAKREMMTYASYDFEKWTLAAVPSFRRDPIPPKPIMDFEWHRGEQVHEGAMVWNRGNVIIGFYGMYHNESNDRVYATQDIGLVISHDAMHFREPVPDFKIVRCFEEYPVGHPGWGAGSKLVQGSFANIGERTVHYYSTWEYPARGMVRVATWPRDRLGFFSAVSAPIFQGQGYRDVAVQPHVISCPISLNKDGLGVYVNADRLHEHSRLRVELLDEAFYPLPGYSGDNCIPIAEPGLRQRVSWKQGDRVTGIDGQVRVRVDWEGLRPEDAQLFAVYVG